MARDAAEREADQILPKSEVSKLWRRFRACCAHCVLDVPIDSGANGHNKYITSGGDSSGVCSGQNIYRVPVRLHTHAEVLQQCLGNYAIRSTWKTAPLDG
jgi:hypothetical protein